MRELSARSAVGVDLQAAEASVPTDRFRSRSKISDIVSGWQAIRLSYKRSHAAYVQR